MSVGAEQMAATDCTQRLEVVGSQLGNLFTDTTTQFKANTCTCVGFALKQDALHVEDSFIFETATQIMPRKQYKYSQ